MLQSDDTGDGVRPWLTGEFQDQPLSPLTADPDRAFRDWWKSNLAAYDGGDASVAAAFGSAFPGLGAPAGPVQEGDLVAMAPRLSGRLGLVAVTRPADAVAASRWLGATNYLDAGAVTVALRSWEDRYGAEPMQLGFDYLDLAVRNPPRTQQESRAAAAEHFAACPDVLIQNPTDGPDEYAASLEAATSWTCWWD